MTMNAWHCATIPGCMLLQPNGNLPPVHLFHPRLSHHESTAVSKPVTAISFDASPVSAGAGSVIINEAEGSGEMSESSIDGYDNWMETDIDNITSTPNTKDPSEDKPAKQQDEIAVPEQDKEAGETSKDYVLKRSLLGELEGSEIKKKKVDGKDLVLNTL